jgi:hypothetical protein
MASCNRRPPLLLTDSLIAVALIYNPPISVSRVCLQTYELRVQAHSGQACLDVA